VGASLGGWKRALFGILGLGRASGPDVLAAVLACPSPERRLVVGLGNPGERYAATRHNVGFRALDLLTAAPRWQDDKRRTASLLAPAAGDLACVLLAKPTTFMNSSGDAVARLLQALAVPTSQMLVVYDDMDLPLGTLRLRERGSAGTHNGMRSIVRDSGTEDFPRLRIGIGQAGSRDARDYVLGGFSEAERPVVDDVLARTAEAIRTWVRDGATAAMNRYNR
jgi:PTH1 family peptidyl-tRNA hydrolase